MQAPSIAADRRSPPEPFSAGPDAGPRVAQNLLLAAFWVLPLIAALPGLLVLAAAAAAIPWWLRTRPARLSTGWLWVLVLGATLVSAALSVKPVQSWPGVLLAGAYLACIWVVSRAFWRADRQIAALRALFWGMVPWAVLGIALVVGRIHWIANWGPLHVELGTWDNRANSVFWHPNILSGYLVVAIAAGLAIARGRWLVYGPALAALAVCQVLTQSRSGWVGTAALAVVYVGLTLGAIGTDRGRTQVRHPWLKAGVALGAIGAALPFAWPRLQTLFDPAFGSNINRLRVWDSARDMIAARPLFGWGPGTWSLAYPSYRDPRELENLPHAHSLFLHLAAEYGIVMLGVLLLLITAAVWGALRTTWTAPDRRAMAFPLAAAVVGYLTMGLFEFTFSEGRNAIAFFTAVGLLAALSVPPARPAARPADTEPGS